LRIYAAVNTGILSKRRSQVHHFMGSAIEISPLQEKH